MHEMSYVIRFVNKALEAADENKADRIRKIRVSVGEMTDVIPEYLHRYYPAAVKGTLLEGSELETSVVRAKVYCNNCKSNYHPDKENNYACPVCKSGNGKIVEGRGVILESIEFEVD